LADLPDTKDPKVLPLLPVLVSVGLFFLQAWSMQDKNAKDQNTFEAK
jgi:hypothetical protein